MKTTTTTALAFSLLSLAPASALAQEAPRSPEWRVDVGLPSMGVGTATDLPSTSTMLQLGSHVTVAHRSGHGARIGVGTSFNGLLSESRSAAIVDAGYVHRFRLTGDDRLGLGLDVGGGLSVGHIADSGGLCFGECTPRTAVSDGAHLGLNAGASLDVRAWVFTAGLDVRGRTMLALEPQSGSSIAQVDLVASLYLGFGFY
jgi:hypothetical protein